jgi:hypothetical protein
MLLEDKRKTRAKEIKQQELCPQDSNPEHFSFLFLANFSFPEVAFKR